MFFRPKKILLNLHPDATELLPHLPDGLVLVLDLVHEGVVAVELLLQAAPVVLERRHGLQLVLHVQQPLQDVLVDLAEGGVVQGIP